MSLVVPPVEGLSALVRLESPALEKDHLKTALAKLSRNRYARRTGPDKADVRVERRAVRDATSVAQHK
jgi:hypothetical protein